MTFPPATLELEATEASASSASCLADGVSYKASRKRLLKVFGTLPDVAATTCSNVSSSSLAACAR